MPSPEMNFRWMGNFRQANISHSNSKASRWRTIDEVGSEFYKINLDYKNVYTDQFAGIILRVLRLRGIHWCRSYFDDLNNYKI
jgi:hypothetical protein